MRPKSATTCPYCPQKILYTQLLGARAAVDDHVVLYHNVLWQANLIAEIYESRNPL
ncbi:hypothetical protein LCGC14_1604530 [marine sediment metagenome]|uniref:Uncharacterized protein n=1 Tax=marine sediment metagenome TaxID=412755 RepID=A0A0F9IAG5_9ZZZZ